MYVKQFMMFFLLAAAGAAVLDQEGLRRLNSLLEVNAKASGEMKARSADEIKTLIEDSHVQFRIDTPNVRVTKEEVEIPRDEQASPEEEATEQDPEEE